MAGHSKDDDEQRDFLRQIGEALSPYQLIEEMLKEYVEVAHFKIQRLLAGRVPFRYSSNDYENAALEWLIKMFKRHCDNDKLIERLKNALKKRNYVAHNAIGPYMKHRDDDDPAKLFSNLKGIEEEGWALVEELWNEVNKVNATSSASNTDQATTASKVNLLEDIAIRGTEIRTRLRELLKGYKYPPGIKSHVLAAYVDIALEHHKAIWQLHESELAGSAFTLVRPVFDTLLRALWINACASAKQIEKAFDDKLKFPRMRDLHDDIKEAYGDKDDPEQLALLNELLRHLKRLWRPMCSYTHSGAFQIRQRFMSDEVKPNYSEGEIAEALNLVTVALLLLLRGFFMAMDRRDQAEETYTMIVQYCDFNERLSKGQ
jgi:hypothetical protein